MIIRLFLAVMLMAMAQGVIAGEVTVGAARTDLYAPLLEGKRVGLLSNHTGVVGSRHTLDVMREAGINVTTLFSPEHGFRGTADAGEHVNASRDAETRLPIISLYGNRKRPDDATMQQLDAVVVDLQDVGLRFYTYYITMLSVMDAAADAGVPVIIFDRPNPNGMTVDGPLLDMSLASGVGQLPIPVIHGMTLGELASMAVGEKWIKSHSKPDLTVIPCSGYTHSTRYTLPVPPSPNLPDMTAVYLYPSTCLFEGTVMSLGRGTEMPFAVYGHPSMSGCTFSFIPRSRPGAKNPPLLGKKCFGHDLRSIPADSVIARGLDLTYIIDAYRNPGMRKSGTKFFTSFFDKLIGNTNIRRMITDGASADEIRVTWADDVRQFRIRRKPYLIYPE